MDRLGLLAEIPVEVWEKGWNVNCKAVGDGRLALRYLAPYVFRVAISNNRIVKVEPGVDGTAAEKKPGLHEKRRPTQGWLSRKKHPWQR